MFYLFLNNHRLSANLETKNQLVTRWRINPDIPSYCWFLPRRMLTLLPVNEIYCKQIWLKKVLKNQQKTFHNNLCLKKWFDTFDHWKKQKKIIYIYIYIYIYQKIKINISKWLLILTLLHIYKIHYTFEN